MRRRNLIKRIGAASTLTIGASGLATAEPEHARVENARGEFETVSLAELERRQDLPSPDDLSVAGDVGTEDCCCDGCHNCICCIC